MATGSLGRARAPSNLDPKDTPGCPSFSPGWKTVFDDTGLVMTASYQALFTITGPGKLDGFVIVFDKAVPKIKYSVDSVTKWELTSENIQDIQFDLGNKNPSSGGGPVWSSNKKTLLFEPRCTQHFSSELKVEVLRDSSNPDVIRFQYQVDIL